MMLTDLEILTQARDLLSNPARWTQGMLAGDEEGLPVLALSSDAVCWCAFGAIAKVEGRDDNPYIPNPLFSIAGMMSGQAWPAHVNDQQGYQATLEMFDRAIEIETAKTNG